MIPETQRDGVDGEAEAEAAEAANGDSSNSAKSKGAAGSIVDWVRSLDTVYFVGAALAALLLCNCCVCVVFVVSRNKRSRKAFEGNATNINPMSQNPIAVTSQTDLVGEMDSPASGVVVDASSPSPATSPVSMMDSASPMSDFMGDGQLDTRDFIGDDEADLPRDVEAETPASDDREISGMYALEPEQKMDIPPDETPGVTPDETVMSHAPSSSDDGVVAMYGTKTGGGPTVGGTRGADEVVTRGGTLQGTPATPEDDSELAISMYRPGSGNTVRG